MSAPMLFAQARGIPVIPGSNQCFFCGGAARDTPVETALKKTFTAWRSVVCPESDWVCDGCPVALDEKADLGKDKPQKIRNYSWVVTATTADFFSKAIEDRQKLSQVCLQPPTPPFAVVIATSGQKQLLFRAPVNWQSDIVSLLLEEEQLTYAPFSLRSRLDLIDRLVPVTGRAGVLVGPSSSSAIALHNAYGEEAFQLLETWAPVAGEPLTRLAAFLHTPPRGSP
jgi:hypothetical protein